MVLSILVPSLLLLKSIILIPLLTKAAYLDCRQRWVPFELWYPGIIYCFPFIAIQYYFNFSIVHLVASTFIAVMFYAIYLTKKMGGYDAMSIIFLSWFNP